MGSGPSIEKVPRQIVYATDVLVVRKLITDFGGDTKADRAIAHRNNLFIKQIQGSDVQTWLDAFVTKPGGIGADWLTVINDEYSLSQADKDKLIDHFRSTFASLGLAGKSGFSAGISRRRRATPFVPRRSRRLEQKRRRRTSRSKRRRS
jgi:hypothetical protein